MQRFWNDEEGATAIEYALVATLIGMACLAAMTTIGTNLTAHYGTWTAAVAAAGS